MEIMTKIKEYTCKFCQKQFVKESTLAAHLCEPKRRYQQRNETGVQIGFSAYLKFYEMTQGSSKQKTYDDFSGSSYYKAFVKFGRYCQDIKAINIPRFIEWILKNNKKIDYWCKDSVYEEYLYSYLRSESPTDALTRAIEHALKWEEETGYLAKDYIRYANSNVVCYAIRNGKVSAWVLYNSDSGIDFLNNLTQDQISIVWETIDPEFWQQKFKDYPEDVKYIKDILQIAGW